MSISGQAQESCAQGIEQTGGNHMIRLTKRHHAQNVSRFYLIQVVPSLFGQWGVLREWGRIGQPGTVRQDWYGDEAQAQAASSKLLTQKLKRGYSQEETVHA